MASIASYSFWYHLRELIEVYRNQNDDASVIRFLEWQANHLNPSIKLISELLLNYVFAVYLFKVGVRNNDIII